MFSRLVGAGYSDLTVALGVSAGQLFGLRYLRIGRGEDLLLSFCAFGLAMGAKASALTLGAAGIAVLLIAALWRRREGHSKWAVVGLLATGAFVGPWLVRNVLLDGHPLSPLPVTVFGYVLGVPNLAMSDYLAIWSGSARTAADEARRLAQIFSPLSRTEALGAHVLPLVMLLPMALMVTATRRVASALLVSVLCLAILQEFFSPGFAVLRAYWAVSSSRFLMPLVVCATPVVVGSVSRVHWRRLLEGYLTVANVMSAGLVLFFFYQNTRLDVIGLGAVVALGLVLGALHYPGLSRWMQALCVMAVLLLVVGFWRWKEVQRYELATSSFTLHAVPRYPIPDAAKVDRPGEPLVIGVTSGSLARADNQFFYYYLGARFQNRLVHVAIPDEIRARTPPAHGICADSPAAKEWTQGVLQRDVDFVVSLSPPSHELGWMECDAGRFSRVAGSAGEWGLFKVAGRP